jgi:hypothetical protein
MEELLPFIDLNAITIFALVLLGFLGGMLSGFIGSGGAFVLTPGMMSLGVEGAVAVASNMCHKFPKALVGAYRRYRLGHVDLKLGLIMAASAIIGVLVGIQIQQWILKTWGKAGSNLYISLTFVVILWVVGGYMFNDARKAKKKGLEDTVSPIAEKVKKWNIPPMITFKTAGTRVSLWITVPTGFATGMLAATIAVGGFIGVPSMIYIFGAPAFVGSGTELVIAFVMGSAGAFKWALGGFVDIRLTVLILAGSLFGVQVGALGTTYVKEYMIKWVCGAVMILAGISRAAVIPVYLTDLNVVAIGSGIYGGLKILSLILLYGTLICSGVIIIGAMIQGKRAYKELAVPAK